MNRFKIYLFSSLLLLVSLYLTACSSAASQSVYDTSFDFTRIISYKITKKVPQGPNGQAMPSATYGLIKSAIDLEMAKKSYGKNDQLADFGITWHTALNDEVYTEFETIKPWENSFSENEEGMLIIDIINLDNNSVVWRGWAKEVLSSQNLEERINEAVREILSKFPPEHPMGLGE